MDIKEFWIKIGFFKKKKNCKISFGLKVLPKVVRLGHVSNSKAISAVMDSGFIF